MGERRKARIMGSMYPLWIQIIIGKANEHFQIMVSLLKMICLRSMFPYLFVAYIQVLHTSAIGDDIVPEQSFMKKVLSKSKVLRRASSYDDMFTDDDYTYSSSSTYFDISKFSVKFHSCASLSSFDFDDFKHEKTSKYEAHPYTSTQVVNYRLCPSDSCQDDSWKGCKNVYGSHVITLKDYFEAKKDYQDYLKESLKEQCEYCEDCKDFYKRYGEKCTYYSSCSNYDGKNCDKYDQGRDYVDYSEYTQCRKVDVKNEEREKREEAMKKKEEERKKQQEEAKKKKEERKKKSIELYGYYNEQDDDDYVYQDDDDFEEWLSYQEKWVQTGEVYVKVYCDGELKVGIFSDSKCSKYIGNQVSIEEVTDLNIEEDDLKYEFEGNDCISCKTTNNFSSSTGTQKMCKNMYEDAVKCNLNIPVDSSSFDEQEMDEWDETLSGSVCSKIEDIEKGNIDGYGILSTSNFTRSPTMSPTDSPTTDPTEKSTSASTTSSNTSSTESSAEEVTSSYMGAAAYYSTANSSDYYATANSSYYYGVNYDDSYNSSSSSNKSIKDYQTDFTNTINNKYMPEGHYVTEKDVMCASWAFLMALLVGIGFCLLRMRKEKREDDYVRSDLIKNESGFLA